MASREWALLKEQVRQRSNGYCERCAVEPYEQTHHVTYERIGKELLEDLLGVCRGCHEFLSAKTHIDPAEETEAFVICIRKSDVQGIIPRLKRESNVRIVGVPLGILFIRPWISRLPHQTNDTDDYGSWEMRPERPDRKNKRYSVVALPKFTDKEGVR